MYIEIIKQQRGTSRVVLYEGDWAEGNYAGPPSEAVRSFHQFSEGYEPHGWIAENMTEAEFDAQFAAGRRLFWLTNRTYDVTVHVEDPPAARARFRLAPYGPVNVDLDPVGPVTGGTGIILLRPTGVTYRRQAGGTACTQERAEGCYVPLPGVDLAEEPETRATRDLVGLTPAAFKAVSDVCLRLKLPFYPAAGEVERAAGREAWVPGWYTGVMPAEPAILTWDNSD